MPPKKLSVDRKNWDPAMLEERRLKAEKDIAANRLRRQQEENKKNRMERWIKFAVVIWAIRLGFIGFGSTFFGLLPTILKGLSRVTGLDLLLFLPHDELALWHWSRTKDKMRVRSAMANSVPFVTYEVPVASPETLQSVLGSHRFTGKAKTSPSYSSSVFRYHTKGSPWVVGEAISASAVSVYGSREVAEVASFPYPHLLHLQQQEGEEEEEGEGAGEGCDSSGQQCGQGEGEASNWYVVEPLPAPLRHPLLTALSPAFQAYINGINGIAGNGKGHGHNDVESMLWVSSAGAECSPHYDMHHNFFLQLAGTKTFIVTEPASGLLLYVFYSVILLFFVIVACLRDIRLIYLYICWCLHVCILWHRMT